MKLKILIFPCFDLPFCKHSHVGEKEIRELKIEGQEKDKLYRDEQCRTANIIEEKG